MERAKRYAEQETIDFSHPDSEYLLDFQNVVGVLPEDEQQPDCDEHRPQPNRRLLARAGLLAAPSLLAYSAVWQHGLVSRA